MRQVILDLISAWKNLSGLSFAYGVYPVIVPKSDQHNYNIVYARDGGDVMVDYDGGFAKPEVILTVYGAEYDSALALFDAAADAARSFLSIPMDEPEDDYEIELPETRDGEGSGSYVISTTLTLRSD